MYPEYRGAWNHEYEPSYFKESGCYSVNACSPNGSTKDCSTASQYCTQTCTGGVWGVKVWGNCKSGYVKINNACTAECSISNGKGYEYAHDTVEKLTHMQCMPESLSGRVYYHPTVQGEERAVKDRLDEIKAWEVGQEMIVMEERILLRRSMM